MLLKVVLSRWWKDSLEEKGAQSRERKVEEAQELFISKKGTRLYSDNYLSRRRWAYRGKINPIFHLYASFHECLDCCNLCGSLETVWQKSILRESTFSDSTLVIAVVTISQEECH